MTNFALVKEVIYPMSLTIENILFIGSLLLVISIIAGKTSYRFGVPTLILFLLIGMLAGSEGIGGIYFYDPKVAQFIGIVALNCILFSGGLDTSWTSIKPVLWQGISLSTLGVLLTAITLGIFVWAITDFTIYEGLLLGAIVSSTDAAAVFSILRSKSLALKSKLRPTLEFATYPLLAGIEKADMIFNIVFFISLTSVLIQGTTLTKIAKWLHVALPEKAKPKAPIDVFLSERAKTAMVEIEIPENGFAVGKKIVELEFPKTAIIAMIQRDGKYITPNGSTIIEANDVLIVLSDNQEGVNQVYERLKVANPNITQIKSG